jgi:hypothetical protein
MAGDYQQVLVQTYRAVGEQSSKSTRARPLAGQGLDTTMKVECSSNMRDGHPHGTIFQLTAKITNRRGGPPFVYTHPQWPFKVLTAVQAADFLAKSAKQGS